MYKAKNVQPFKSRFDLIYPMHPIFEGLETLKMKITNRKRNLSTKGLYFFCNLFPFCPQFHFIPTLNCVKILQIFSALLLSASKLCKQTIVQDI